MWKTLPVPDRSARIIGIQFTKWQQVSGAKNDKFLDIWIILVQNTIFSQVSSHLFVKRQISLTKATWKVIVMVLKDYISEISLFTSNVSLTRWLHSLSTILESRSLHLMQNIFFSRTSIDLRTVERKAAPNPPNRMNFPRSIISNCPIPFCLNTFIKKIFFCYKGLFSLNIAVQIPSNLRIS